MRPLERPFARLNLRYNPFGELEPEARAGLAVVEVEPLVEELRRPGVLVQFLGECGRGKTTRLLALKARFPEAPWVRLEEGVRPVLPAAPVLFLDDADFLPPRTLRKLLGGGTRVACTTHRDLAPELPRAHGPVTTLPVRGLDVELLRRIVERRIEHARRAEGPLPHVPEASLRQLIQRHGDNVRAIEFHLYERFQRLEVVCDVEV